MCGRKIVSLLTIVSTSQLAYHVFVLGNIRIGLEPERTERRRIIIPGLLRLRKSADATT